MWRESELILYREDLALEKKKFFFLYNTSPVSRKTWSVSLQGLGDLGNWATRLGRALEQFILHSWGGGEEQDGAKWREIENRAEGVEEHLPGVPRLPRLSTVFLEAWVEAASRLKNFGSFLSCLLTPPSRCLKCERIPYRSLDPKLLSLYPFYLFFCLFRIQRPGPLTAESSLRGGGGGTGGGGGGKGSTRGRLVLRSAAFPRTGRSDLLQCFPCCYKFIQ